MKKYKKFINIHYHYVDSPEAENALAEIFDDIFMRIIKRNKNKKKEKIDRSSLTGKKNVSGSYIVDNS
jgi:hypothetical protein